MAPPTFPPTAKQKTNANRHISFVTETRPRPSLDIFDRTMDHQNERRFKKNSNKRKGPDVRVTALVEERSLGDANEHTRVKGSSTKKKSRAGRLLHRRKRRWGGRGGVVNIQRRFQPPDCGHQATAAVVDAYSTAATSSTMDERERGADGR